MWKEERFQKIRTLLQTYGRVTIKRAAEDLDASRETIRRDFSEMEQLGELKKIRGGAIALDPEHEPPITLRNYEQRKEKRAIAKAVVSRIKSGQTLFIDAGSTTSILAEELAKITGITVITNSLYIAQRLSCEKCRLTNSIMTILLGGMLHDSLPATFGEKTIAEIYRHHADITLVSPVGLDAQYGATSFDPAEAEIARAMIGNSKASYLLADSTKIGRISRVGFCPTEDIDVFFTDKKALKKKELQEIKDKIEDIVFA
ncbi:DeoR/GlpR family DNA-binding transcription regulator [Desulfosediminicola ganghwensis]|uniref:DeoR/GlpR family DNA-binding transcription regulator n=1 Tax=Desulfosediminicola ganghwensis TaxID=2569540 RepID=UPI0010ABF4DC|nr:DeoR/GlpR family DNA-binding transcription regulator [Desulfosediminicola ganghwensis]